MQWFNVLVARILALVHRDAVIEDIDEELRIHVEMDIEANVERGMSLDEARRSALARFGREREVREVAYDVRGGGLMESIWHDIRFGVRMLAKSPMFTAIALLMVAVGVGANSAIFSAVNGVLLRPLPYQQPDRLVMIWGNFTKLGLPHISVSVPEYLDYHARAKTLSDSAAYATGSFNLTGDGPPEQVQAAASTASLFQTLGVQPTIGRAFTPEEDTPGNEHVVVLSHGLWTRRFAGDPSVVGRSVQLDGLPYQILGVMPSGFDYPSKSDIWVPIAFSTEQTGMNARGSRYLNVVGRLAPDATVDRARNEIATIANGFLAEYPNNYTEKMGWGASVTTLNDEVVGDIRPALWVLLAAVGLLLLIACANVANLLLARASVRQREIAIRAALGAGRGRVVRQLLVESLLLAIGGGVIGLVVASWGVTLLAHSVFRDVPRAADVGLDWKVVLFSAALSVGTGVLFGLAPAVRTSGVTLNELLREGGRGGTTGPRGNRLRSALVVAEVALAMMLVVGAGLMMRSFNQLWRVDAGFKSDNLLTMQVALPQATYSDSGKANVFYSSVLEQTAALPGVEAAALTSILPLDDNSSGSISIEGRVVNPGEGSPEADFRIVSPDYFRALGIDVLQGRSFTEHDTADGELVAVVDETLAQQLFPPGRALGGRVRVGGSKSTMPWLNVVGIVKHVRQQGLDDEGRYQLYFPYRQSPFGDALLGAAIVAKTRTDPAALAGPIRGVIEGADPNLPVAKVRTMEEIVSQSLVARRMPMILLAVFAGVALLLAVLGLYGVISYSVTQRTSEIGIRMALGADPWRVLLVVARDGFVLSLVGIAIGLVGAFGLDAPHAEPALRRDGYRSDDVRRDVDPSSRCRRPGQPRARAPSIEGRSDHRASQQLNAMRPNGRIYFGGRQTEQGV